MVRCIPLSAIDMCTIYWYCMFMRMAEDKLKSICSEQGMSISDLLNQAGISRNAFYTLARKKNVLPHSIRAIANTLNISASEFMEPEQSPVEKAQKLYSEIGRVKKAHKDVDPDNVRHTLQLLDEKPVDRLRRALTRAQRFNFQ